MRDEHDRHAELVAQREEQVEQADADGYVDHRHRLVGDDHARVDTERARDGHALALSAGELVRVLDEEVRGRREADALKKFGNGADRAAPIADLLMAEQRRRERLIDGADGIERGIRVLMHELH